jgi:hypothetical protein
MQYNPSNSVNLEISVCFSCVEPKVKRRPMTVRTPPKPRGESRCLGGKHKITHILLLQPRSWFLNTRVSAINVLDWPDTWRILKIRPCMAQVVPCDLPDHPAIDLHHMSEMVVKRYAKSSSQPSRPGSMPPHAIRVTSGLTHLGPPKILMAPQWHLPNIWLTKLTSAFVLGLAIPFFGSPPPDLFSLARFCSRVSLSFLTFLLDPVAWTFRHYHKHNLFLVWRWLKFIK